MNKITSIVMALALALCVAAAPMAPVYAGAFNQQQIEGAAFPLLSDELLDKAWKEAKDLSGCPKDWARDTLIALDPVYRGGNGYRLLGTNHTLVGLDDDGLPTFVIRIYIYLLPREADNNPELLKEIIVHEQLHSIYMRLSSTDPSWDSGGLNSEQWVRKLMGEQHMETLQEFVGEGMRVEL